MNIFYLDEDPIVIAHSLVDKHIVKMPTESAQMLSTAHRILDGRLIEHSGKRRYLLQNERLDEDGNIIDLVCYMVAHSEHPSTKWTMLNRATYQWHLNLLRCMLQEYTNRYGRVHRCADLLPFLDSTPTNIVDGDFVAPFLAMPDEYKCGSAVDAYRAFYAGEKWTFANWKHNNIPGWFAGNMKKVWSIKQINKYAEKISSNPEIKKIAFYLSFNCIIKNETTIS